MIKDTKLLLLLHEIKIALSTIVNLLTSPVLAIVTLPVIIYYVPQLLLSHIIAIVILLLVWKAPEHD